MALQEVEVYSVECQPNTMLVSMQQELIFITINWKVDL